MGIMPRACSLCRVKRDEHVTAWQYDGISWSLWRYLATIFCVLSASPCREEVARPRDRMRVARYSPSESSFCELSLYLSSR
eukprot:541644-Hanusia_phi.AAC.1